MDAAITRGLKIIIVAGLALFVGGCKGTSIDSKSGKTDLETAYLRCEYRVNPLSIDVRDPRLSWILRSDQPGQYQKAYQILVSSSTDNLKQDKGDLWDSGKVDSSQSAHIVYEGKELEPQMRCYWKVRAWDSNGSLSAWGDPGSWTMSLLDEGKWQSQWIGFDAAMKGARKKSGLVLARPRYLRKTFELSKPVSRATVYASALGWYQMRINGERIGQDYFTPGWTDYNIRVYYNSYDVTELMHCGENAIGSILADGWFAGYIGWNRDRAHYGDKIRFSCQLHIEYSDGTKEIISTDKSWKAATGPLLEADILMGETYDARKELSGWDSSGFDDKDWEPVNITAAIDAKLQAYPMATVQKFAEIKPVKITEPEKGVYVFDMGTNFAGWARLKVKGKSGDKIVLRFGEQVNPDGTLYTANLLVARATETYICRGGGEEIWEPCFTFHGFQYVEVTGYPGKPDKEAITGIEITSAIPVVGSFECSEDIVNKFYRNICQTQRANFIEVPTDCPQRSERFGWTGDAQIYINTAIYNADVASFFTKWMVDVEDAQQPNGVFAKVAPLVVVQYLESAGWSDAGVILPWSIYRVYGDKRILSKHYEAMAKWIDHCQSDSDQLLRPAITEGDWLNIDAETPEDLITTAYFAYSTKLMARVAGVLNKGDDVEKYEKLFEGIKQAFNKAYVAGDGRIKGDTQTAYVLALKFDLLDGDASCRAVEHLVNNIKDRDWHLSTGFLGTKDLMMVLTDAGRTDVAYRLFHNETYPSWLFAVKHGATSIWERWDGWTPEKGFQNPEMNSFAHYAFGAVGEWMFKTIAGIDTDDTGYKNIIIRPRPGGKLKYAKANYNSIHGVVSTSWTISEDLFKLDITIPVNCSATVYVPCSDAGNVRQSNKQAEKFTKLLKTDDGNAIFSIGSGKYQFVSKLKR